MLSRTKTSRGWDDLVGRLATHDIHYLMSDQDGSPVSEPSPLGRLILDLASAREGRLRDALIALLLRHPRDAALAASNLTGDEPAHRLVRVSLVVAAALQREWGFSLSVYIPDQLPIEADHLAAELGLPSPREDFGRPCLTAAAQLLRYGAAFPFNYEVGWEDAARRLLAQLAREARHGRT